MRQATNARLLIVDDEAAQIRALCNILEEQGYDVLGCPSGEAALAALRHGPFDLLLADLMMPGMNGIALLRAALAIDPMLVGIIMTGEGTIDGLDEASGGALDHRLFLKAPPSRRLPTGVGLRRLLERDVAIRGECLAARQRRCAPRRRRRNRACGAAAPTR